LTIDLLPEDVLVEIFDFCKLVSSTPSWGWQWHTLVHVCRRWRSIVFASQHRLDLRLFCTYGTPVKKTLDCWPPLPIAIRYSDTMSLSHPDDDENIIAALQYRGRVCEIELTVGSSLFTKLSPLMQESFPSLESLTLKPRDNVALALPSAFLGASTTRLRNLCLDAITPPALPTFLPSFKNLVCLRLLRIPDSAYISPDALLAGLASTTQLKILSVQFATQNPPPPPPYSTSTAHSPSMRHVVLPALCYFEFRGTSEFLENLVARIRSTPSLARTHISFFDQSSLEIPQISQFVSRMAALRELSFEAKVHLREDGVLISFSRREGGSGPEGAGKEGASGPTGLPYAAEEWLRLHVSCAQLGQQVPLMAQICRQISPLLLSGVRKLEIVSSAMPLSPHDVADASEWVGLFHTFSGVKELHVSYRSVPDVARTLRHVAQESAGAEVLLPALRDLHFDWFASKWEDAVASFLTARQLSGRSPITFHRPKIALA
jgi:hypothetical protein